MSSNNYININGLKISHLDPFQNFNNTLDTSGKINEKIQINTKLNTYNYIVEEILNVVPDPPTDDLIFVYTEQTDKYSLKEKITESGISSYTQLNSKIGSIVYVKSINNVYILKEYDDTIQIWNVYNCFDSSLQIDLTHTPTSLTTTGNVIFNSDLQTNTLKVNENSTLNKDTIIHNNTFEESLTETNLTEQESDINYPYISLYSFIDSKNNFYDIGYYNNVSRKILIRNYNVIQDQSSLKYIINKLNSYQILTNRNIISYCLNEEDILFIISVSMSTPYTYYLTTYDLKTHQEYNTELILNDTEPLTLNTPYKVINFNHMIYLITYDNTNNYIYIYQYDYDNNTLIQIIIDPTQEDPYKYQLSSIMKFLYVHNDIKTNKQILYIGLNSAAWIYPSTAISVFDNSYNITLEEEPKNILYMITDYLGNIYILPSGERKKIIKYTPEHNFIYYDCNYEDTKEVKNACIDKNNNIYIIYDSDNTHIGILNYNITSHNYEYSEKEISEQDTNFSYITFWNEFLIIGHGTNFEGHNIIVYRLSEGNLIKYDSSTFNNNLSVSNAKLTVGDNKIILNGYNGDIYTNNINSYSGTITKTPENIYDIINKKYFDEHSSDIDLSQTVHFTNQDLSILTDGNVEVSKQLISNNMKTNDIIIDGSRVQVSNNKFDNINDKILYYEENSNGLYVLIKDTDENLPIEPADPDPGVDYFKTDYHLYYINFDTSSNILSKTEINLDISLEQDKYKIITAYVYNDLLYVLFNDLNQSDVSKKYICNVFNMTYHIKTYTTLKFEYSEQYQTPFFNKFIHAYTYSANDVYLIDVDRLYTILFENKEPTTLIELLWYDDDPTSETYHNQIINERMYKIHMIVNKLYLMCNNCFYTFDLTNITMNRYDYNCIEYPGPQAPPDNIPSIPYNHYTYQNSVCDFIIAYGQLYAVFIKFEGHNNIYYIDDRTQLTVPVIRPLLHPPVFVNNNICTFTVKNGYIYYITELPNETDPSIYDHKLYIYNSQNRTITNIREIDDSNYQLEYQYNSLIPLIYTNNGGITIETIGNYKFCKIWFPLAEISGLNTYIKNIRILNDSIVLASPTVINTGNSVSKKIITNEQIIKTDNEINITTYTKIDGNPHHYYSTTKGLFYFISESLPGSLKCFIYSTHRIATYSNPRLDINNEIVQTGFIYNDMLYLLIGKYNSSTKEALTDLYIKVFDIINNTTITLINTIQVINDENTPYNGANSNNTPSNTNFLSNYYIYDANCVSIDTLYIYNAYTNRIYYANLLETPINLYYIDTLNLQEYNVPKTSSTNPQPGYQQKNINYSNVESIINNNSYLYFIYCIRILDENNKVQPISSDDDPQGSGTTGNNIHFKRKYNIYVYNLNDSSDQYNIYIQYDNYKPKPSEPGGLTDVPLFNYAIYYDEHLYINFLNQNRDIRGLYYINKFNASTELEPTILVKNNQIYPDNAYSYNIIDDKFFVITTQDFQQSSGPQLFSYYFNLNIVSENTTQTVKFAEKINYSKFSNYITPLLLENTNVLLVDYNKVFNIYEASMFSHLFSNSRSIINNNVTITPTESIFHNNFQVSSTYCRLSLEPKNNNDVVNKIYVDNIIGDLRNNELVLKHTENSLSTLGNININGSIYNNEVVIGDFYKYGNVFPYNTPLYYGNLEYGLYLISPTNIVPNPNNKRTIYLMNDRSLDIETIDNVDGIISAFIYNYKLYILLQKSILIYNNGVKTNTYNNITGYNLSSSYILADYMYKSIVVNSNVYLIFNDNIYYLTLTNDAPTKLEQKLSINVSNIYNIHYIETENSIYILTASGYYIYDITGNSISSVISYTYADSETHTYKYSIMDNNRIYIKYELINKIYYIDNGNNPNIKIFTGINDVLNVYQICNFNVKDNSIYFINMTIENSIYTYDFYKYENNKFYYNYELNSSEIVFTTPYNSNMPLIIYNHFICNIDTDSTIANRYPSFYVKIQPVVITKDYTLMYNNLEISENYCRTSNIPIEENDIVNKKYVDKIINDNNNSFCVSNIVNTDIGQTDDIIFVYENNYYSLKHKVNSSYENYDVSEGARVLVKSNNNVYVLQNYTNNTPKKQIWSNHFYINNNEIVNTTYNYNVSDNNEKVIATKKYVDDRAIDLTNTVNFTGMNTSITTTGDIDAGRDINVQNGTVNVGINTTNNRNDKTYKITLNGTNGLINTSGNISGNSYSVGNTSIISKTENNINISEINSINTTNLTASGDISGNEFKTNSTNTFAVNDTNNVNKTILQNISTVNASGNITTGGNVSATGSVSGTSYSVGNTTIISKTEDNINIYGINDISAVNLNITNDMVSNEYKTNSTNSFAVNDTNNVNKTILQNISTLNTSGNITAGGDVNASGNITATGSVSGTSVSGGSFNASGNITATGSISGASYNVGNTSIISKSGNNINISGINSIETADLSVSNDILSNAFKTNSTNSFAVNDTNNVNKTILQNISTLNTSENITAGGNVNATGDITGASVSGASVSSSGNITATGSISGASVSSSGNITATGSVSGASYNVGNTSIISKSGNNINISGINSIETADLSVSNDILSNAFKTNSTNTFAVNDTNNVNKTILQNISTLNASGNITTTGTISGASLTTTGTISGASVSATGNISTTTGTISGASVSATGNVSGSSYSVGNTSIISKTGNNINISNINNLSTTNLSVSNDILSNAFKTNSTNSFAVNDTNNVNKTILQNISTLNTSGNITSGGNVSMVSGTLTATTFSNNSDIVNKKYVDDAISGAIANIHSIDLLINQENNMNNLLNIPINNNYYGPFSIKWIIKSNEINNEIIINYDYCQLYSYQKSNNTYYTFNATNIKLPYNENNCKLLIDEIIINNNIYKCLLNNDTIEIINGLKIINNDVKIPYLINMVNNNDNIELHYNYNENYESSIIKTNENWIIQFNNVSLNELN